MKVRNRNRPNKLAISFSLRFKPKRITKPGRRIKACRLIGGPLSGILETRTGATLPFTVYGGVYEPNGQEAELQWRATR